jgi:hypothetical protein
MMSVRTSSKKKPGKSNTRPAYLQTFVKHVHKLIFAGYQRIDPTTQKNTNEERITELLVVAINSVIGEDGSPKWMERYHATDDRRVSYPGRDDKSRPRVDIEFILCRGVRPLFHFECKRLRKGHSLVSKKGYLGEEGLGCFLMEQYARGCDEGGMLGYVQSEDCSTWAKRIEETISADPNGYRLAPTTKWESHNVIVEIPECYWTRHMRPNLGTIIIYHSLLLFCEASFS